MSELADRFDYMAWKGFGQSASEFEKGYKHAFGVAAKVLREEAPKMRLESAVIEAAIKFRKAETAAWVESEVGTEESAAQAKKEQPRAYLALLIAADALIKARETEK